MKIINDIMKTSLPTVRVSFWVILGIAILLTNLALSHRSPAAQEATATPATQTNTSSATEEQVEPGSTDGIMVMAVVIVMIVIIPILLKQRAWENGKRKKTAPPR